MKKAILFLGTVACLASCSGNKEPELPLLDAKAFEATVDGKKTSLYTLKSGNGVYMQVTNLGARVVSLFTPDKNGKYEDIALGYENIDRYINNTGERFIGTVVGRYANRIAGGSFELDSVVYNVPINNNGQSLHGGLKGFDMAVWNVDSASNNQLVFSLVSPDGDEGYPGAVTCKMVYTLTPNNEFKITYEATTDKPTVINLSHHGFFNLKGAGNGTITDHVLMLNASHTTPVDSVLIPTGEIVSVDGTPFDFRTPTVIGARIDTNNVQLKHGGGYDHNWVIDKTTEGVELVASLYEPVSGRFMEVWTDQPGIQFYCGNFFNGETADKYGKPMRFREAVALETQKFPDSPNHPHFPSTRLNAGEKYMQTCIYKFAVKQ
ncbi:MAG: galactose mutarotase [Cytophagaceae bacterium]|jgi:aldose 1-epimerase|nr:galactose mutarotase [Cytophagaceae bacterium]